jgi:hypothetical protein
MMEDCENLINKLKYFCDSTIPIFQKCLGHW